MAKAQPKPANTANVAKTKPQGRPPVTTGFNAFIGGLGAGFNDKPDPGTYATYRKMRSDPTIALARAVATAPLKSAAWSVEARDDADEAIVEAANRYIVPLIPNLVRDMCYGLDYGWSPFEKVWGVKDGMAIIAQAKPLLPDFTEILVDAKTGAFAGVKQGETELNTRQSAVYTHDGEAGDFYGRSRHENIRTHAWKPGVETLDQTQRYVRKTAGVIPIIHYPVGESATTSGVRKNDDIARDIMNNLGQSKGIAMPEQIAAWAQDLIRQNVNIDSISAWRINFLESGTDHAGGFIDLMRYFDSLKFRGWLVPERAAIEGQHGTMAEATAHADIGIAIAEETLSGMAETINQSFLGDFLALNYGEDAREKVLLVPERLIDSEKAFIRSLTTQILTNPAAYETAQLTLDLDAMLDRSGLPKAQEIVDARDPNNPQAGQAATPVQASRRRGYSRVGAAVMGRSCMDILTTMAAKRHETASIKGKEITVSV